MMKKYYPLALKIATDAHKGQMREAKKSAQKIFKEKFDNVGVGEPYINHPIRIAEKFEHCKFADFLMSVAVLHDVLEDTNVTYDDLIKFGLPKSIADIVRVLSRLDNESYFDFIMRIMESLPAILIKIEDINDNLVNLDEGSLKDKYRLARYILNK